MMCCERNTITQRKKDEDKCLISFFAGSAMSISAKDRKPKKPHYVPRPPGKPFRYQCFQCPFTCNQKSHLFNHMKYNLCKISISITHKQSPAHASSATNTTSEMNASSSDVSRETDVIDTGGESEPSLKNKDVTLFPDEKAQKESVSSSSDVTRVYKPEALLPRVSHVYGSVGVWRPPVSFPPSSSSPEHKPHLKDREMLDFSYHGAAGYYSYDVPIPLHPLYSQYYTPHLIPYAPLFPRELLPVRSPSPEEYFRYYHTFVTPQNQNHPIPYSEQIHHGTNMTSGFLRYEAGELSSVQHITSGHTYEERELGVNVEGKELQVSPHTGCSADGSPDGTHPHRGYQQPEDEEAVTDSQSEERGVVIQMDEDGQRREESESFER